MKISSRSIVLAPAIIIILAFLGASLVRLSFESPSDLLDFLGKVIVGIFGFSCFALIGYLYVLEQLEQKKEEIRNDSFINAAGRAIPMISFLVFYGRKEDDGAYFRFLSEIITPRGGNKIDEHILYIYYGGIKLFLEADDIRKEKDLEFKIGSTYHLNNKGVLTLYRYRS